MYLSHFGFSVKPFQISTDPRFLWLGEKHKEALAVLEYGVMDNRGFLLLTGDVGTGKTTLINRLLISLQDGVAAAMVPDPGLNRMEFFNYISRAFGIEERFDSKEPFLSAFSAFLDRQYSRGKRVLLIIDEAQRLSQELLEEIRLLSNIEKPSTKLLNVFFVGQNEFNDTLLKKDNRAIRQRITINYHIDPLTRDEIPQYIGYRLKVAGAKKNPFSHNAVDAIHSYSGGYPRPINIICDHALLTAYVGKKKFVTVKIIRECAKELDIRPFRSFAEDTQPHAPTPPFVPTPEFSSPPRAVPKPERNKIRLSVIGLILVFLILLGLYFATSSFEKIPIFESIKKELKELVFSKASQGQSKSSNETDEEPVRNTTGEREPSSNATSSKAEPDLAGESPSLYDQDFTEAEPVLMNQTSSGHAESSPGPGRLTVPEKTIVHFDSNSFYLDSKSMKTLNRVAEWVMQEPNLHIELLGYTDSSGDLRYNLWVSKFRANIVKIYLLGKGVDPRRINAKGLGPADPIAKNDTSEGRRLNRRVEIKFRSDLKQ